MSDIIFAALFIGNLNKIMIRTGSVLLFTVLIAISALSAQETQETSA